MEIYVSSNPNPTLHYWRLRLEEVIKQFNNIQGGMLMTHNQIAYQEYLEKRRSNKAAERETKRSNLARETETARSNVAKERIDSRKADISAQANRINRELGYANVNQRDRAVLTQDATNRRGQTLNFMIQSEQHGEQTRSNLAKEQETARHNQAAETETALHNRNVERENTRSAIKRENENLRSNLVNEDIARRRLATDSLLRLPNSLKDLGSYTKSIWRVK